MGGQMSNCKYTATHGEPDAVLVEDLDLDSAKRLASNWLEAGEGYVELSRQNEEKNQCEMWSLYTGRCNMNAKALDFCGRAEDCLIKGGDRESIFIELLKPVLQGHNQMLKKTSASQDKLEKELKAVKRWRHGIFIFWMVVYAVVYTWGAVAAAQGARHGPTTLLGTGITFPFVYLATKVWFKKRLQSEIKNKLKFSSTLHSLTAVVLCELLKIEDDVRCLGCWLQPTTALIPTLNATGMGILEHGFLHEMHGWFESWLV